MASAFSHAIVSYTMKKLALPDAPAKVSALAMFCSAIPDADVIAFRFGIPYEHMFGHRGFTHSIFFSLLLGFVVALIFHKKDRLKFATLYFFATLSHAVLDAMTTGGRGVAILAPFSDERFFLPWRFIKVSPMSIQRFFTEWGWKVMQNEFVYLWIPCISILFVAYLLRKLKVKA